LKGLAITSTGSQARIDLAAVNDKIAMLAARKTGGLNAT